MSKTWKWILIIAGLLVIVFIAGGLIGGQKKTEKVATGKAVKRTIVESVHTNGKIYPENQVTISPDFSGQVTELNVEEGDTVKKGEILARINNRTAVESPINGIVLALKVKKGESVTGNSFSIGTEMMIIADMSKLEIKVDVGENDIIKLNKNDSVEITVDAYSNRKFKGWVTVIPTSPKSNPGFSSVTNEITEYEVRIRLDEGSYQDLRDQAFPFRPGMNASADIKTRRVDNVLAVPIGAVNARVRGSDKSMADKKKEEEKNKDNEGLLNESEEDEDELEEVVFVLENGKVRKVVVKTGIQDINYIEILSGLKEGDEVVTDPYSAVSKTLRDGMKVKVVPKDKLFEK